MTNKILAFPQRPKHDPAMANVLDEIERAGYTDPDGKTLTNDRHWHALRQAFELIRDIDPVAEAVMVRDVLPAGGVGLYQRFAFRGYDFHVWPNGKTWVSRVSYQGVILQYLRDKPTETEARVCAVEWIDAHSRRPDNG